MQKAARVGGFCDFRLNFHANMTNNISVEVNSLRHDKIKDLLRKCDNNTARKGEESVGSL